MNISEENFRKLTEQIPTDSRLIVFDGTCVLCNSMVGYLLKIDRKKKFRFATFDSEIFRISGIINVAPGCPESIVLIDKDGILTQSDAVLKIAGLSGNFAILSRLGFLIPRTIRDAIYRLIARNRYRWFGKTNSCIVPSPAEAYRFFL